MKTLPLLFVLSLISVSSVFGQQAVASFDAKDVLKTSVAPTSNTLTDQNDLNNKPYLEYVIDVANLDVPTHPQLYNQLMARVPNLRIANQLFPVGRPNITLRNNQNVILLIDGIRYDLSVLNVLNPQDIQKVTISPSPIAVYDYLTQTN